jgi:DNA ligase-1
MDHTALMHGIDADLDSLTDYVGWFAQEKYRGIRLFWDGHNAWTRQGKAIALPDAPEWQLPSGVALDAELFDGNGIPAERRCATAARWGRFTDSMRIVVFDVPRPGRTWEQRYWDLIELDLPARATFAQATEVLSVDRMLDMLAMVQAVDGEGLMLRKPGSLYTAGRSTSLRKVKYAK